METLNDKIIKVLFVYIDHLKTGGTENVMINIINNIDHDKFHIDLLLYCNGPANEIERSLINIGTNIFYIAPRREKERHGKELDNFFAIHKYDVVHTHMNAIGNDALIIAKKHGVKVRVAHSHNTWHQLKINSLRDLLHYLYLEVERYQIRKTANVFIGCSDKAGQWLFGRRICSSENYLTFNNAIDVDKYAYNPIVRDEVRSKFSLENNKVIIHVGRFDDQKNQSFLIRVFQKVYEQDKTFMLLLVGEGPKMESVNNLVMDLKLSSSVRFLGRRDDVSQLLQAADIFAMPSLYEGLPLALVEAQAAGLKCIVSDRVSRDVNISKSITFLSIDNSVDLWSKAITYNIDNDCNRTSCAEVVRNCGFDMKTNINQLEEVYKQKVIS